MMLYCIVFLFLSIFGGCYPRQFPVDFPQAIQCVSRFRVQSLGRDSLEVATGNDLFTRGKKSFGWFQ